MLNVPVGKLRMQVDESKGQACPGLLDFILFGAVFRGLQEFQISVTIKPVCLK